MKRGEHTPDAAKRRKAMQRKKKRYMELRDELETAGVIPVEPTGAVRDERVNPASQVDPLRDLPPLIAQALREGWATPDAAKPAILASLLRPFFNHIEMLDKDGNLVQLDASPKLLNELARTLGMLDQRQYERDNPEAAGKAKGGTTVNNNMNVQAAQVIRGMVERGQLRRVSELLAPVVPSAPGDSGHAGPVEAGELPAGAERRAGGGVGDAEQPVGG